MDIKVVPSNESKASRFLELLNSPQLAVGIGANEAVGAHLVEEAGFDFIWASGLAISSAMGVPDASILGMDRFLSAASVMNAATRLPIVADCDTGFGGINNAIYMAEQYASAGIAAVCVEDKLFPKQNSFKGVTQEMESIERFEQKLRAIRRSVGTKQLAVIARTEAFITGGNCEEALRRANAYASAGADAVLVHSKRTTAAEIEEFMAAWNNAVPVIVVPTTYPQTVFARYSELGVGAVICANQLLRACISHMRHVLKHISDHNSLAGIDESICPVNELVQMFDGSRWVDL